MRRLLIDSSIKTIASLYMKEVKSTLKYDGEILNPAARLTELLILIDSGKVFEKLGEDYVIPDDIQSFRRYISYLLRLFNGGLLVLPPSRFERLKRTFDKILPQSRLSANLRVNGETVKPFNKIVQDRLQYSLIRKSVIGKYIRMTGVKTCVYCNANYTITEESGKAFMEIDHWKPKSVYPFLSISFYNLQPTCSYCNKAKSNDSLEYFNLYEEDPNASLDVFRFHLPESNLALFRLSGDRTVLNLKFNANGKENEDLTNLTDRVFHISQIYAEHKDIIEELLRRKQYYNASFVASLQPIFKGSTYSPSLEDVKRFILGMYMEEKDVLKRPLNKMMLDIFKEG